MHDRIGIGSAVCHGAPVIHTTRVPVALVLGSLASGMSYDEIQTEYELAREDILAALRFAERVVEQDRRSSLGT